MSVNYALKALQDTALRSEQRVLPANHVKRIAAAYQRLANYEQKVSIT